MHRRIIAPVLFAVPIALAASAVLFSGEPVRGIDLGSSRLVKSEPFPAAMAESCTWEAAAPEVSAFQGRQGAAGGEQPAMGDPRVAARPPITTIRDPYPGFSAIRVDPVHNEVVVMDEFKFDIYVYDRLAVTPASATATTPKRVIGGGKTLSRYNRVG
jgi:hypothetical protein